ncbi:MAG: hypothetical protein KF745_13890 [Phycisphaeraceae bacterium]|nr:hypothetical protein [Phycisphaeraceae bacterium]
MRSRWLGWFGAAAVVTACAGSTIGESTDQSGTRPAPPSITGRTFSGIEIGGNVQQGDIVLTGAVGSTWVDEGEVGGRPTTRLLLSGDVTVSLGVYRFNAARAVVWIETIGTTGSDPQQPIRQVAVFFDRVGDPVGEAGVSQSGDRLLVTGTLSGQLSMKVDLLRRGRRADPFVAEAERRLANYLRDIAGARGLTPVPAGDVTVAEATGAAMWESAAGDGPMKPGLTRPYEPQTTRTPPEPGVPAESQLAPERRLEPIFAASGLFTVSGKEPVLVTGAEDDALIVTGGATVHYTDRASHQDLMISAERAVLFLKPGPLKDLVRFKPEDVRGVYVEGDVVATSRSPKSGQYTLRSPRIYYDVTTNIGVAVDAVFWTYDSKRGLPLYVRAKAVRQEAGRVFTADGAVLSTTSFTDPTFSMGAGSVTITRETRAVAGGGDDGTEGGPGGGGGSETVTLLDAKDITLRAGPLPFFYWPHIKGEIEQIPLVGAAVGNMGGMGPYISTTWNTFSLLGLETPAGLDSKLLVDGYFDAGAAIGTDTRWDTERAAGGVFAYTLIDDNGTDVLPSGARIDQDGTTRGVVWADHRWAIDENWSVLLTGSYVSDPTFLPAYFREAAEEHLEFTNLIDVRRTDDNSVFSVYAQGELIDFTPNEYLLQSQGYSVNKTPEGFYSRYGDDLLGALAPGLLSYSSEYRVSGMSLNFTKPTASQLGFTTTQLSQAALGLNPNQSPADALAAQGYNQAGVTRLDTRQELKLVADLGPVKVVPFATGRLTSYSGGFETLSAEATDDTRWWGAAGVKASTSFYRVDDDVESVTFDLHRIRHMIEPNITFWSAGTNLDSEFLPVYDADVEQIAQGTAVRFGVDQTWQTQRGGEGRWRNVDVFKLGIDATLVTSDTESISPIGRFFEYRPEYSNLGNFGNLSAMWQPTDAVALTFKDVYDFDLNQQSYMVTGLEFSHVPEFRAYVEGRFINSRDSTIIGFGGQYELTRKYIIGANAEYDTDAGTLQTLTVAVRRKFPGLTLGATVTYDGIADQTSFGIVFEPLGLPASQPRGGGEGLSR